MALRRSDSPGGDAIMAKGMFNNLPDNYRASTGTKKCSNCKFVKGTVWCTMWHDFIGPNMVCNKWVKK